MNLDPSIFKTYDIRGIYPDQLDEEGVYNLARAVATMFLRENNGQPIELAVGGDMRTSTPALKERVIAALRESGVNVADIGLVSTPTFYFAVADGGFVGGVQVSASHNPKEWNGLKLVRKNATPMSADTGIKTLQHMTSEQDLVPLVETPGALRSVEGSAERAVEAYVNIAGKPRIQEFSIVVDTANAMGALDYEALFKVLPGRIEYMNFELDGTFPNHEADPLKPENTEALRKRVVESGAHLGIAADGDSDRVFVVDDRGRTVPSPILYTILAKRMLEKHSDLVLAYEVRMGMLLRDEFQRTGVRMVPTPVGHSLEKAIMLEHGAAFGGEISGHYFFRMPFGTFEAPGLAIIYLLSYLTEQSRPLSSIVDEYMRYASSGEVNMRVASRDVITKKIEQVKKDYSDGVQSFVDGIKVEYADWWFSLRPSNTEPLMRLIVEANSQELMETKRDELLARLG